MRKWAEQIRLHTLEMIVQAKASHIGSCFSLADLLAVLYFSVLHIDPLHPKHPERDRCIVSKGHAAACVYAALALRGFFPVKALKTFGIVGSNFLGHLSHRVPGVELSTGSLGHGLSVGCGMALAGCREQRRYHTYVLISDGELNEGSTWEGILFAGQHKLRNLTMIVDYNKIQSFGFVEDILDLKPLHEKFQAFQWDVCEIDGHHYEEIESALRKRGEKPTAVIAHTVKGKGVSFMENNLAWHYKDPSQEQYAEAVQELCDPLLSKR